MNHTQVLDLLVEHGLIGDDVVDDVVAEVTQSGLPLAKVLEKQGVMPEAQFYETIASMFGVETVNLEGLSRRIRFWKCFRPTLPPCTARCLWSGTGWR